MGLPMGPQHAQLIFGFIMISPCLVPRLLPNYCVTIPIGFVLVLCVVPLGCYCLCAKVDLLLRHLSLAVLFLPFFLFALFLSCVPHMPSS